MGQPFGAAIARLQRVLAAALCATALAACERVDMVGDNCTNGGQRCTADGGRVEVVGPLPRLSLLLVVENTATMAAVQEQVALRLPRMLGDLLTGRLNGGPQTFEPPLEVRVAVVSSDLGAPGVTGDPLCGDSAPSALGDDGWFLTGARVDSVARRACDERAAQLVLGAGYSPSILDELKHQAACAVMTGTQGCRYPMPLDAALKALWTDAPSDVSFTAGEGHGAEPEQAGFVHPDGLLAIIVIAQHDDCSSLDTDHLRPGEQLAPEDPLAAEPAALRCVRAQDHLQVLGRYQDALPQLATFDRLFYGVVAGVPAGYDEVFRTSRSSLARERPYQQLLDELRAAQVVAPGGGQLQQLCTDTEPAVRLSELAQRLNGRASSAVASLCNGVDSALEIMTIELARVIDPATNL